MKDAKRAGTFHAIECDLTDEKQVREAFDWVEKNLGTVHILINNAGLFKYGKIVDLDFVELKKVIDTNFIGLLLCSKLATAMMLEAGHESHVVMINSIAGLRIVKSTGISSNVYSATKFAVNALAQTLETDFFGRNIRITNISPGAVETEMFNVDKLATEAAEMFDCLETEDIADAVVYAVGAPSRVQIEALTIKPRRAPY